MIRFTAAKNAPLSVPSELVYPGIPSGLISTRTRAIVDVHGCSWLVSCQAIVGEPEVPPMPLSDVAGKVGAVAPEHIVTGNAAKRGVVLAVTFTVTVTGVAQSPAVGVKVYVPVAVLLTVAGFQVPVTPFVEVVGSAGAAAPEHIVAGKPVKVGVVFAVTFTVTVTGVAQSPAVGVKV